MAKRNSRLRRLVVTRVKRFTQDPRVRLGTAIILILTGLLEVFEKFTEDAFGWSVGVHHGIIVFGTLQLLRAVTEIVEGIEGLEIGEIEGEVEVVEREVEQVAAAERQLEGLPPADG